MIAGWGFAEVWVDPGFLPGRVEWLDNGGVVLSPEDWIRIVAHLRGSDGEIWPHIRETHSDF